MSDGRPATADSTTRDFSPESNTELPPFSVVYETYFDLVWSAARHLGVSPDSIDDVVQEVFVVIHARLNTVQRVDSLRSWVYSVARRTVSTFRRAQRSRETTGAQYAAVSDWMAPLSPTPLDETERNEQQRLVWQLLSELDEPKREVFILAEIEEFTAPEIAEALGLPVNTVYSRLRSARQAFDQGMTRYLARQQEAG